MPFDRKDFLVTEVFVQRLAKVAQRLDAFRFQLRRAEFEGDHRERRAWLLTRRFDWRRTAMRRSRRRGNRGGMPMDLAGGRSRRGHGWREIRPALVPYFGFRTAAHRQALVATA